GFGGDGGGGGGGGLGHKPQEAEGLELSLYPASAALPTLPSPPPPPLPQDGMTKGALGRLTGNGFPHDSRYCWWSDENYRPAHPLLGADVTHSSAQAPLRRGPTAAAAAAREEQQRQQQQQGRRPNEPLLERLLPQQQQQQEGQRRAGSHVSPRPPKLPLPVPPSADGAATLQPSSGLPFISPFQGPSRFGWRNEVVGGAAGTTAVENSCVQAQA
ncbi:hypothetical protein Vretifemale_13212, partial [Volvox reticuliferus]